MDNNMTAIVSLIMIGLGFLNGMIISTLFDKIQVGEISQMLSKERRKVEYLENKIEEMEEELQYAKNADNFIKPRIRIPPPDTTLERSKMVSSDDDSDCDVPTSSDENLTHKD